MSRVSPMTSLRLENIHKSQVSQGERRFSTRVSMVCHPAARSIDPNYGESLSTSEAVLLQKVRQSCSHLALGLASNGQEELELGRELILGVEPVGEVDSANTAVSVNLNSIENQSKD